MKFCLVSGATKSLSYCDAAGCEEQVPEPHLGVLAVASLLEAEGIRPTVIDLDGMHVEWLRTRRARRRRGDFAHHVADCLAATEADWYGFSSNCSSYPLTVRSATLLKQARPTSRILFGGPQATGTAEETLKAFSAVDLVVQGEAENVISPLVRALRTDLRFDTVPGIVYRRGCEVARAPAAPIVEDLDRLPTPSFHLWNGIRRCGTLPLELGRGCPYSCTYCSTSQFFQRRYRLKSPDRVVEEMAAIHSRYGTRSFTLVHDNFPASRDRARDFCSALLAHDIRFSWTCSARTDCVDRELIELMKRAGCRGIFFGIETGSPAVQRSIRKNLDLEEAPRRLRLVDRCRITAAAAFMMGFPEETPSDLEDTLRCYVDVMRRDYLRPQISLLSPLPGTEIHAKYRHELLCDGILSDIAFQGREPDARDWKLINDHPDVFSSYYAVPTRSLDRLRLIELRHFLVHGEVQFRWLLVGLAQVCGSLSAVFDAWRDYRQRRIPEKSVWRLARFYARARFRREFLRFVRREMFECHPHAKPVLKALVDYHAALGGRTLGGRAASPRRGHGTRGRRRPPEWKRSEGIDLSSVGADFRQIIRRLRRSEDVCSVLEAEVTVVTRLTQRRTEILQIGQEAAYLLGLCNGRRSLGEVRRRFAARYAAVRGIPGRQACLLGLEVLRRQRRPVAPR